MDLTALQFRASVIQKIRQFFIDRNYLELDTPALSPALIPDTSLEVFEVPFIEPWAEKKRIVYLVPSPDVFIKKIIAKTKASVFQISKCYRNAEMAGRTNSPEFTSLNFYTMGHSYTDSLKLTEELFSSLLQFIPEISASNSMYLKPPFTCLTVDDAFDRYAGFRPSDCPKTRQLADQSRRLKIPELQGSPFDTWPWEDLFQLILVQCVEPELPQDRPVFLTDFPVQVPSLAKEKETKGQKKAQWKERWELYAGGMKLAECRSEETNPRIVKKYFDSEGKQKNETALVPHTIDENYWKTYKDFPDCSSVFLNIDELLMLLAEQKSIEAVMPFPFRLQIGYY